MKNKIYFIISFVVVFLGLSSFVIFKVDYQKKSKTQQQRYVTGINVGNLSPDIISKTTDNKKIKLSDLRGKVVIIDFWASWCKPCRLKNPSLVRIYKKYNKSIDRFGANFIQHIQLKNRSYIENKILWEEFFVNRNWPGASALAFSGIFVLPYLFYQYASVLLEYIKKLTA